ncbi:hypothetical protein H4S02_010208 [Coemansia sp. RSA 2611]|nr:hypothetical protein H4S02_010208 [Coemansia sp. RSA 2611]
MNQNPFAFFSGDGSGYAQLPEALAHQAPYLDARSASLLKDSSQHTSSMSHASHDSDSNPSTPSKKADRRTPKSKAEVSERMRRWRSENAEKNRLNDLRCRVYRQARIRFGKEPTPEREAWIQSEIFRRLERRRLREAMKGGAGSVPAPTAIANPAMGAATRSRSTVHAFPMHHVGADHAMAFPPYSMMGAQPQYAPHHAYAHPPHGAYLQAPYAQPQPQPQQHQPELYGGFKFISPLYGDAPHAVPSHQPLPEMPASDFSGAFQPPAYAYYHDASVPAFEPASADASHAQSHSSPPTPTDPVTSAVTSAPQYALHAAPAASSAFTSLAMVGPAAVNASPTLNDVASNLFALRQDGEPQPAQQAAHGDMQPNGDMQPHGDMQPNASLHADRLAAMAAAAASQPPPDAHHLRHSIVQPPLNLVENINFQNYS